jgi:3',5'-nucleoside bisphosphate phosphatase
VIDLHAHSNASDGSLPPAALVALGAEIGLKALALTDHDTVDGVGEAMRAAEGGRMRLVPGIELSARLPEGTLHVVGLFIDHEHPAMTAFLGDVRRMRDERNARLTAKLEEIGMPVSLAEAAAIAGGEIVGRPHFAAALVRKGYAQSLAEVFEKILGRGGAAHVFKERFSPEACIGVIRAAGGVPILAHPDQTKRKGEELDALVAELKRFGLSGIETHCAPYTSQMVHDYRTLGERHGLLRSGGSDFHGKPKPDIRLGRGFGSLRVPDSLLEPLERAAEEIRKNG